MAKTKKKTAPPPAARGSFSRLETGIAGLDTILNGGFLSGGTYLILGAPGTGKTVLSNQFSFHQITKKNGRALYVTLLAENHARMFGNLNQLEFFDETQISNSIQYVSGYKALEEKGLDGLLRLLSDLIIRYKSTMLFIDGVASADALSGSAENFKKFVHSLNTVLGITGCTTFLLSSASADQTQPEHTMVDGIVHMTMCDVGMRMIREIEVRKFRGSAHLQGRHFYEISRIGLSVYPRIEALLRRDREPSVMGKKRLSTGTAGLDELVGGGITPGSVTSLLGPAGTGKTTVGTKFLEVGAANGEVGLLVSLYEHPNRVIEKKDKAGSRFGSFVKNGKIRILRIPPGDQIPDKIIHAILSEVREYKVQRLYWDGIAGIIYRMVDPERVHMMMDAVAQEFRALNVAAFIADETDINRSNFDGALSNSSGFTDNIIEFRHVFLDGMRTQILCATKTRDTANDSSAHRIVFEKEGVSIGEKVTFLEPYLPLVAYADTDEKPRKQKRK